MAAGGPLPAQGVRTQPCSAGPEPGASVQPPRASTAGVKGGGGGSGGGPTAADSGKGAVHAAPACWPGIEPGSSALRLLSCSQQWPWDQLGSHCPLLLGHQAHSPPSSPQPASCQSPLLPRHCPPATWPRPLPHPVAPVLER
jgi:hypothetical protein